MKGQRHVPNAQSITHKRVAAKADVRDFRVPCAIERHIGLLCLVRLKIRRTQATVVDYEKLRPPLFESPKVILRRVEVAVGVSIQKAPVLALAESKAGFDLVQVHQKRICRDIHELDRHARFEKGDRDDWTDICRQEEWARRISAVHKII
jgi:hypothetical protein